MVLKTFDGAFLINRQEREDRLEQSKEELKRVGIEFSRLSAIEPEKPNEHKSAGERGCLLSHYRAVAYAEARNWNSVLIMEDDIVFRQDFLKYWEPVRKELEKVEWDIFYGYDWNNRNQFSPPEKMEIYQLDHNCCCHFWAIHSNFYDKFLGKLSKTETKMRGIPLDSLFDSTSAKMFAPNYNLVGQRVNESDTDSNWQKNFPAQYNGVYWHG